MHSELHSLPSPKYLKATLLTALATALIPCLLFWVAYTSYYSPSWDGDGDSGAVQGFLFFAISAALALVFVITAFPATAKILFTSKHFSTSKFLMFNLILLALLSFLLGFVVSGMLVGSYAEFYKLGFVIFIISSLLSLPFAGLWLKLAK